MELYIEKDFLDKFNNISPGKIKSKPNRILTDIFNSYGNTNCYIDAELKTIQDLENLKSNLIQFSYNSPIPVNSIREHFLNNLIPEPTLIFTLNDESWHQEAEGKGALCFSFKNYKDKIKSVIKICESIKVDLSQNFPGWRVFSELKNLPKNKLIFSDNFLIQRDNIHPNVINLLQNITTKQLNAHTEIATERPRNQNTDCQAVCNNFKNQLNEYALTLELVIKNHYSKFKFHDRFLYSNFFYIEIPIGINFNANEISDSIIRVETIFDKFHYDRVNNHMRHFIRVKNNYSSVYS